MSGDPALMTNSCDECEEAKMNNCGECSYYKYRISFRILAVVFGIEMLAVILCGIFWFAAWTTADSSFVQFGNSYTIAEYTTLICGIGLVALFLLRNVITSFVTSIAENIRESREEEENEEEIVEEKK